MTSDIPAPTPKGTRRKTKVCPYCAERIQDAALVCRYCGRDQKIHDVPPIRSVEPAHLLIIIASVVVVGGVSILMSLVLPLPGGNLTAWIFVLSAFAIAAAVGSVMMTRGYRLLRRVDQRDDGSDLSETGVHTLERLGGLMAISVGLFGILITGVFVFMTLRIDSGARQTAQEIATNVAMEARQQLTAAVEEDVGIIAAQVASRIANEEMEDIEELAAAIAADVARQTAISQVESVAGDLVSVENQVSAVDHSLRLSNYARGDDYPDTDDAVPIGLGTRPGVRINRFQTQLFRLLVPARATYTIEAQSDALDLVLYLWAEGNTQPLDLLSSNDDTVGVNPRLEEDFEVGAYYIGVLEFSGSAGSFSLSITSR